MRSRSAVVRCSSSSGVVCCCICNASTGQPIWSDASAMAERSCFRRAHCCVDCRVSYDRFFRVTGVRVATAYLFCLLMHTKCALPPPYGLLGCLNSMRVGHSMHSQCPSACCTVQSRHFAVSVPTHQHAAHTGASNEHRSLLYHAVSRTRPPN